MRHSAVVQRVIKGHYPTGYLGYYPTGHLGYYLAVTQGLDGGWCLPHHCSSLLVSHSNSQSIFTL